MAPMKGASLNRGVWARDTPTNVAVAVSVTDTETVDRQQCRAEVRHRGHHAQCDLGCQTLSWHPGQPGLSPPRQREIDADKTPQDTPLNRYIGETRPHLVDAEETRDCRGARQQE